MNISHKMCSQYFWGISCEQITFLRQKVFFFSPILGGHVPGAPPPPPSPPGSAPGIVVKHIQQHIYTTSLHVSREVVPIDRDKEDRSAEGWGGWGVGEPFNTHFWV